jgi:hypothetical protein
MKIFEGKSPTERNKLIAALVLGALALLTLVYTFGGMFTGGRKTTVTVNVSPTPTPTASTGSTQTSPIQSVSQEQITSDSLTRPVVYTPGSFYAPDAGRNIFAFYEPPAPTPPVYEVKYDTPKPTPPATPAPTPPILLGYISPQSVYAGSKNFRLELNGDKFTPDSLIFWNGSQIPTNFVNGQRLTADISSGLITGEGQRTIEIRTPDGKYSNSVMISVQAPPKPNYQYIGMIARRRNNNDTAYLQEPNKPTPFGMRLNDLDPSQRFRMVSISAREVILEDTNLGFRHPIPLTRPSGGAGGRTTTTDGRGGFGDRNTPGRFSNEGVTNITPYNPTLPQTQEIPGIPSNIPRYIPPTPQQQQQQKKEVDDDDEDGDN